MLWNHKKYFSKIAETAQLMHKCSISPSQRVIHNPPFSLNEWLLNVACVCVCVCVRVWCGVRCAVSVIFGKALSTNHCIFFDAQCSSLNTSKLSVLWICVSELYDCVARAPCLNGGTCKEEGSLYHCDCTENYHGDTCTEGDMDIVGQYDTFASALDLCEISSAGGFWH